MEFQSEEEKKYYYHILDAMESGVLSDEMRRYINDLKISNGISDEMAKKLEEIARDEQIKLIPELHNDNERDYYKWYLKMMDDGIMSDSERIFLNNKKNSLSISYSRANEIENLYKPYNNVIVKDNNEKDIIIENNKDGKKVEIIDDDKSNGALKRWKYLNKVKFVYFHIFTIAITLIFEIYFFIRLKGTINNLKPVPTTFFEKLSGSIKSGVLKVYTSIVPESIQTGIEMANNVLFNVILIALLIVFLIVLFVLYTYSSRIISVMISKTCKQTEKLYKIVAVIMPISMSLIMVLFTEWDHM